jgi:putative Holliday junction resolvase
MPVLNLDALAVALPTGKRLMGLDVGDKTVGVALSDTLLMTASPIDVIRRTKFTADADKLIALIRAREAAGIVVGLPVNMDGSEGPRCQSVRQFAANLLGKIDLPLAFWDERLSTAAVERMLVDEMDVSRARRREVVDKAAAAYILQGALEALRTRRG